MQLIVEGVNPDTRARTLRAYKVCNSYLYILDQVLLPTRRNDLSAIPAVNATFLQALASLGSSSSSSSSSSTTDNVSSFECSLLLSSCLLYKTMGPEVCVVHISMSSSEQRLFASKAVFHFPAAAWLL